MVKRGNHFLLRPKHHSFGSISIQHLQTRTQMIFVWFWRLKLDIDEIRSFCASRICCRALNMVEEGKKVPWDTIESSWEKES